MHRLSIGNKLYLGVLSIFLLFAVAFIVFQQHREKQYKIDTLNLRLQDYNERMHVSLTYMPQLSEQALNDYVNRHKEKSLRVTLIDTTGRVLFDNERKDYAHIANHKGRKEIAQALSSGSGSTVERNSMTVSGDYFYSATYFPHEGYIIRTALPYDDDLAQSLQADQHYIWFALAAIVLLTLLLYRFTRRLGHNIRNLQTFASRADHDESLDTDDLMAFSDDELGEIAERIIKLYKRLKTTRHEQDRLKRELTQNAAHELKTPVASIQGYMETLISHPEMSAETRQQFIDRCYKQSERLGALLSDMSTLNRLDDGKGSIDFETVDLSALIAQIQQETALQLERRQMTFTLQVPAQMTVKGNRSMLYSIFRNLTDNAIAYAGEGTRVTLSAQDKGSEYAFSFADNGVGVGREHLSRIFERFYRVDKGRSRKLGGTGLGLAIVKNAVLLHGGQIEATPNPGGGLRFEFTLKKEN